MSLVAYGSSDEGSDSESDETPKQEVASISAASVPSVDGTQLEPDVGNSAGPVSGSISDSDSDLENHNHEDTEGSKPVDSILKALPSPKERVLAVDTEDDVLEEEVKPKASQMADVPKPPPKKTKQPVQIILPALSRDSDEEDEPVKKKFKPTPKPGKTGLAAMLPEPVHAARKETNRILLPHTLKRPKAPEPKKPAGVSAPKSATVTATDTSKRSTLGGLASYDSDSGGEEEGDVGNFFSLDSLKSSQVQATPSVSYPGPSSSSVQSSRDTASAEYDTAVPTVALPPGFSKTSQSTSVDAHTKLSLPAPKNVTENFDSPEDEISSPFSSMVAQRPDPDAPLTFKGGLQGSSGAAGFHGNLLPEDKSPGVDMPEDPEAYYYQYGGDSGVQSLEQDAEFLRMQGKKHRGKEEINIVDVNADDFISTAEVAKNLTEESDQRPSRKKKDMPTSQQRRKHQISYLAFQAKEMEIELKNQWSNNKMTKRQTQAKYGF